MTTRPGRRAIVGPAMIVVGVVHVAITPVLFPDAVRSVLDAGVVNAVEADPAQTQLRGIAFWFATTGIALVFTGWVVGLVERRTEPVPVGLPLFLLGIGAWGVVLMPKSPFWVFLVLAAVAAARRTGERRTEARK